jgi:succinyl-diaminopimelate desuccinylase
MKGAVACFVAAAARYLGNGNGKLRGSLSLLITGDEEGPSVNGTVKVLQWLERRREALDACIVGEPSSTASVGDEIKIGRRGSLNGELIVKGKQGHAAYPHIADNPVPKLARMIDRLAGLKLDEGTRQFSPCIAVTVAGANTATNVIPGQARALFNIRYNDTHTRSGIEQLIGKCCAAAAAEVHASYTLSFSGTGDVFLTQPGPLVEAMAEAVREVTGQFGLTTTGGVGCALHQGLLPGRGAGARQRDDPSGGRARPGRGPRDADAHLRAVHRAIFRAGVSTFHGDSSRRHLTRGNSIAALRCRQEYSRGRPRRLHVWCGLARP